MNRDSSVTTLMNTEYPNGRVLNTLLSTVHVLHEPSNPAYLRTMSSYRHNSYVARRTMVRFGVSTFVHVHTVFSTLLVLTNLSEEGKAATTTITIAQKQCFSVNELWLIDLDVLIFVRHHFILPTRVDEHKTSSPPFCSSHFGQNRTFSLSNIVFSQPPQTTKVATRLDFIYSTLPLPPYSE